MRRRDLIGLGLGLASSKLFCAPPAAWDLSCDVAVAGGGGAGRRTSANCMVPVWSTM